MRRTWRRLWPTARRFGKAAESEELHRETLREPPQPLEARPHADPRTPESRESRSEAPQPRFEAAEVTPEPLGRSPEAESGVSTSTERCLEGAERGGERIQIQPEGLRRSFPKRVRALPRREW